MRKNYDEKIQPHTMKFVKSKTFNFINCVGKLRNLIQYDVMIYLIQYKLFWFIWYNMLLWYIWYNILSWYIWYNISCFDLFDTICYYDIFDTICCYYIFDTICCYYIFDTICCYYIFDTICCYYIFDTICYHDILGSSHTRQKLKKKIVNLKEFGTFQRFLVLGFSSITTRTQTTKDIVSKNDFSEFLVHPVCLFHIYHSIEWYSMIHNHIIQKS